MKFKAALFDEKAVNRAITRIAHEIAEKNESLDNLCIIGIKTRGVPIAKRLCDAIYNIEKKDISFGVLDITLYRDDLSEKLDKPLLNGSLIDFDLTGKKVILTDDVIYTGRTVRAALDAIMEKGRPSLIQLAVLVDRGHRELPIRPDYVGKNIPTSKNEIIRVELKETDGRDRIDIYEK